jgi:hypothetical protein
MWDRGVHISGGWSGGMSGTLVMGINSAVQLLLGTIFSILGFTGIAEKASNAFQIIGPALFLLGVGLGIGAIWSARKMRSTVRSEIRITSEARQLMWRILNHIGWQAQHVQSQHQWIVIANLQSLLMPVKTAKNVLQADAFEILDQAAKSFNRINGVIKMARKAPMPQFERVLPSVSAAADEAMIAIFNAVAVLDKMPESAPSLRKQIQFHQSQLDELAQRVDRLTGSEPSLTEQYASGSAMTSVLEQLRLEQAARDELRVHREAVEEQLRQGE